MCFKKKLLDETSKEYFELIVVKPLELLLQSYFADEYREDLVDVKILSYKTTEGEYCFTYDYELCYRIGGESIVHAGHCISRYVTSLATKLFAKFAMDYCSYKELSNPDYDDYFTFNPNKENK